MSRINMIGTPDSLESFAIIVKFPEFAAYRKGTMFEDAEMGTNTKETEENFQRVLNSSGVARQMMIRKEAFRLRAMTGSAKEKRALTTIIKIAKDTLAALLDEASGKAKKGVRRSARIGTLPLCAKARKSE